MSRHTADLILKIDGRKFITPIVVNVIRDERTMGYIVEPESIRYFMTWVDDVRENVNGEWEEIEVIAEAYDISGVKTWASKMKCDQCGFTTIAIEGHFSQYNFCPNCGSDMRSKS